MTTKERSMDMGGLALGLVKHSKYVNHVKNFEKNPARTCDLCIFEKQNQSILV